MKRHYKAHRQKKGLPTRCDNSECQFYSGDLIWNNQELKMILDHVNGNSNDNRPENLRYLCPNCDSQLPTRGGRNIGRIKNQSDGGYQINNPQTENLDTLIFPKTGKVETKAVRASITTKKEEKDAKPHSSSGMQKAAPAEELKVRSESKKMTSSFGKIDFDIILKRLNETCDWLNSHKIQTDDSRFSDILTQVSLICD